MYNQVGLVAQVSNFCTWEDEIGVSGVQGQHQLHSEFSFSPY